jgi:hypothetical protein
MTSEAGRSLGGRPAIIIPVFAELFEKPVVEDSDRAPFERRGTAGEPI